MQKNPGVIEVDPFGGAGERSICGLAALVATDPEKISLGRCDQDRYGAVVIRKNILQKRQNILMFNVYDGHGASAKCADFVSNTLPQNFAASLACAEIDEKGSGAIKEALRSAYITTNAQFIGSGASDTSGSCALSIVLAGKKLYIANAGDCRAVVLYTQDGQGEMVFGTTDQTARSDIEKKRIEALGGRVVGPYLLDENLEQALSMGRAFGDKGCMLWIRPDPAIDEIQLDPQRHKLLIVASDGVWCRVGNVEAVMLVKNFLQTHPGDFAGAAKLLVDAARSRGSKDDITAYVVDLKSYLEQLQKEQLAPDSIILEGSDE